jgi:hypothetical protein
MNDSTMVRWLLEVTQPSTNIYKSYVRKTESFCEKGRKILTQKERKYDGTMVENQKFFLKVVALSLISASLISLQERWSAEKT